MNDKINFFVIHNPSLNKISSSSFAILESDKTEIMIKIKFLSKIGIDF